MPIHICCSQHRSEKFLFIVGAANEEALNSSKGQVWVSDFHLWVVIHVNLFQQGPKNFLYEEGKKECKCIWTGKELWSQLLRHSVACTNSQKLWFLYTRSSQSKSIMHQEGSPEASSLPEELLKQLTTVKERRVILLWGCGYWYVAQAPEDGHTPMCIWTALIRFRELLITKR